LALIECKNLCMGYEGKEVLTNISFSIEENDCLYIVGENGSGKSTLIKGLLRIKSPTSGKVVYENGLNNNKIGFLPQQRELTDDFPASVHEIVLSGRISSMGIRPFYNKKDKQTANEYLKLLGITNIKNKRFTDLSGGQKQRVLLARALCATKQILLLDEPTAGLDPKITSDLYTLIDCINKEKDITVIIVSHDVAAAMKYANKILHLGDEEYFYGSPDKYINSNISKRFLKGRSK